MADLKHECGVAAVYHFDPARPSDVPTDSAGNVHTLIPRMLIDLQNRGQLAAGMTAWDPDRAQLLETYREVGLVAEAFRMSQRDKYDKILSEHAGRAAIGHVRYATSGPTTRLYAQPYERKHGCKWKWFAFGFNGNLANFDQLKAEIETLNDYHMVRDNDTEALMHLMSMELAGPDRPDLVDCFRRLALKLDGSYNVVFLNAMGDMIVLRDPLGLRPLCYAADGGVFAAASESVALQNLGFKDADIRSLNPGELIHVRPGEMTVHRFAPEPPRGPAHCFFEWVYFANVASTLDDKSVYLTRTRLGKELAKLERERILIPDLYDGDTIVVPVPDTAKAAADGMAYDLKVPCLEGLMRNRYVGRTFIEATKRADKVRLKFTPLREVLKDRRVILVEDSIVRSTTLMNLLGFLKERGEAREVHVRVACPPIVAPCFYGIDMSQVTELFAPKHMAGDHPTPAEEARMARQLGADSLMYLPVEALAKCVGLPAARLCQACVTGTYPTAAGEKLYQLALRDATRDGGNGRAFGRTRTPGVDPAPGVHGPVPVGVSV